MAQNIYDRRQALTDRVCTLMITHSCNLNCVYCFEKYKSNKHMAFETAQKILQLEFDNYISSNKNSSNKRRLAIELFGGEPLLNFTLIEQITTWVKSLNLSFEYIFQITTNGTLFTDKIKKWLIENKDIVRVVLSVDGSASQQAINRGCSIDDLPMAFVKQVWPNAYFKMTISPATLNDFSNGIIQLSKEGYKVAFTLAEGQIWDDNAHEIYERELLKICDYFLNADDAPMDYPLNGLYYEFLDSKIKNIIPEKKCGAGTNIAMYDTDGQLYPCHLFLPMVHGNNNVLSDIEDIDFSDNTKLTEDKCKRCPIVKLCITCYGYNYSQRGNIGKRDLGMCKLRYTEAKVISKFQVEYYMKYSKKLNDYDMAALKAALACYKHMEPISISEFEK